MKKRISIFIAAMVIIVAAMVLTSCSQWDPPFKALDKSGDTVSVRYFAGEGGMFLDKAGITLVDVFNLDDFNTDGKGNREVVIANPVDVKTRLPQNASTDKKMITHEKIENVRLIGWAECDANGTPLLDENGDYKKLWVWENERSTLTLKVPENGSYSSANPVLNLVAIWQPYASFEIYWVGADGSVSETPNQIIEQLSFINIPYWKDGDSEVTMGGDIDKRRGYTFVEAYADAACTVKLPIEAYDGGFKYEPELDASSTDSQVFKIYITWEEGEWYRIYNAKQLRAEADPNGCYRIMNDIDFDGATWPADFSGYEFKGKFVGADGGITISGITFKHLNTSSKDNGLFSSIGAAAEFSNITFDGVTFYANAYRDSSEVNYGILAGRIADGAKFDNFTLSNSTLVLTDEFFEGPQNGSSFTYINIISPMGNTSAIKSVNNKCIIEVDENSAYADYVAKIDANGNVSYGKLQLEDIIKRPFYKEFANIKFPFKEKFEFKIDPERELGLKLDREFKS